MRPSGIGGPNWGSFSLGSLLCGFENATRTTDPKMLTPSLYYHPPQGKDQVDSVGSDQRQYT